MNIQTLEQIALNSQKGALPRQGSLYGCGLDNYEHFLPIGVRDTIQHLTRRYNLKIVLCADIGCDAGIAAAEINRIERAQAFGIDKVFSWNESSGLPRNRYIVADAGNMPHVPADTFHLIISKNSLKFPRIITSFSEIYRILAPGGIAVIDCEAAWLRTDDELNALVGNAVTYVITSLSGRKYSFQDYLRIRKEAKKIKKNIGKTSQSGQEEVMRAIQIHEDSIGDIFFRLEKPH